MGVMQCCEAPDTIGLHLSDVTDGKIVQNNSQRKTNEPHSAKNVCSNVHCVYVHVSFDSQRFLGFAINNRHDDDDHNPIDAGELFCLQISYNLEML